MYAEVFQVMSLLQVATETLYACWFTSMQATYPTHHSRQIVVSKLQTGRQKILNWLAAGIPWIESTINFCV